MNISLFEEPGSKLAVNVYLSNVRRGFHGYIHGKSIKSQVTVMLFKTPATITAGGYVTALLTA